MGFKFSLSRVQFQLNIIAASDDRSASQQDFPVSLPFRGNRVEVFPPFFSFFLPPGDSSFVTNALAERDGPPDASVSLDTCSYGFNLLHPP